ncbi:peptidase S8 family protein [Sphingomonas changbaiensis NBRC 104936]|uniref:Peptidase S8 family protein n=1 Tax=Sphingomonas changbaiensis NBRC 104936 TaxID=1219043 RepID=A0A0E9MRZ6_9SPHN|nr:S8 family peptidase [Sphingomonas changbaiensis]GAO40339.1 peptidase S8 family protein [Sphingomonas changbaiensis NBRC 104936]
MSKRIACGPSGLVMALLVLAGCGGGGGVSSVPPPAPAPTPAPVPTPTPTPTPAPAPVDFQTAEYNRATGLRLANAIPAYQAGSTGRGVTAAVIDSGVNPDSVEFVGRISPASQDVAGSRGLGDDAGHGSAVADVLLGAKNDFVVHGAAFDATLLALRTDTPGSCGTKGDCSHSDTNIARALDIAVTQGARVANISLGGVAANLTLRNAISRATAAGMVIVISAGNDSAADPSQLALIATDPVAHGQVIVAGSYDANKAISSFSNRAGSAAAVYLTALGEGVRAIDQHDASNLIWTGTSFSAPFVSGAVALLAQAFPNLTGAQIVQLLFDSADDLGAAGTDPVYGRGGLDIGRAFAARGSTSLAGSQVAVDLAATSASLSPAMGDAAQKGMGAVVLDGFSRAYAVDFARSIQRAQPRSSLAGTLGQSFRGASLAAGGTMVAVSIADTPGGATVRRLSLSSNEAVRARATAGMIASRIDPRTSIAFGFGQSGASVAGQLVGRSEPAFLVARGPGDLLGFDRQGQRVAMVRRSFGRLGVTASAESGEGLLYQGTPGARDPWFRSPYSLMSLGADRRLGGLRLSGGLTRLTEDRTVLGAHFGPLFGGGASATWFADLRADWRFGPGWSLAAAARQGWTHAAQGGLMSGSTAIRSNAFSFDVAKTGVLGRGDQFAFRIAQPLRVSSGGLGLRLPTSYDYATGAVGYADELLNLSPTGREIDMEASYARMLLGGRMDANLFWRRDPGNFAAAPDDRGAALRWRVDF